MLQSKKTPQHILHDWLIELNSQPSIIKRFDVIELEELVHYINGELQNRFERINAFLVLNPNYSLEWAFNNMYSFGMNYNRLNSLNEFIVKRIDELTGIEKHNTKVFRNIESENFFKKVVNEWLKNDENKKTSIAYVFRVMWVKTSPDEKPANMIYEIVCNQPYFAEYWNNNYSKIFAIKDTKQPRFKTLSEITSNKYKLQLTAILEDFKTGD